MLLRMNVLSFCHYLQGPPARSTSPTWARTSSRWSRPVRVRAALVGRRIVRRRRQRLPDVRQSQQAKHRRRPQDPAAGEIKDRLVDWADVVVENFRPGVMDRLGLGYEEVRLRKPEIVYASATGLGASGPMKDRPGQDLLMQARSGLMAVTANHEVGPTAVGAAIVDQHGGALLAMGILAAFVRRLQTGEGTRVEGSLLNAGIDLQTEALTKYFARTVEGDVFTRDRHVGSWYHHAPYGVYRTADGHVALSMNDAARVADALDSDTLRSLNDIDRYAERDRYARAVAAELRDRTCEELAAAFDARGVWFERVQSYDALRADPQVVHSDRFRRIPVGGDRTATIVNHPLRYDGALPEYRGMPFRVGDHSREILEGLGFGSEEIDRYVAGEVVVAAGETRG